MNTNFLLTGTLTDFQLKFLELIQYLRENTKGATVRHKEPFITLQYSYITSVLNCSHGSVKSALDRLAELKIITPVSNNFGECAKYRYNPSAYNSLISQAKERECILITGRKKQHRTETANQVLKYMTGKAIMKGKHTVTHVFCRC